MPGSAISGGAARAAAVAWWLQRHQRLPPPAELLPRGLLDRAVELAQKTAAAAAPDLDPDLPCSLGPSSLPDHCDGLLACLADTNGYVSLAFKQFYQMVMPCDECGLSSSVISSWRYSWRPMEQAATRK